MKKKLVERETAKLIIQLCRRQEEAARQLQQALQQAESALLTARRLVAEEMKYYRSLQQSGDLSLLKDAVFQLSPAEKNTANLPGKEPPQLQ